MYRNMQLYSYFCTLVYLRLFVDMYCDQFVAQYIHIIINVHFLNLHFSQRCSRLSQYISKYLKHINM